jgi:ribosome-associated protein YbcJ (S4-like RNA binding protein)
MLSQGREITVHGHRSAREGERLVKAERVVIDGTRYDLYPGRDS